jgi:hypothetical protein
VISGQDSQEKHVFQILAAALKQHTLHNHKVSIRAKNNDPLEVLVFTGVFERPFWLGCDVRDKAQQ